MNVKVDGAFNGHQNEAGLGGVARDDRGRLLSCMF